MSYNVKGFKKDEETQAEICKCDVELYGDHDVEMLVRAVIHSRHKVVIEEIPEEKKMVELEQDAIYGNNLVRPQSGRIGR